MADDAARARVGEPVGARKRRLPASVRDAARPKAKTTPREKSARGASAREKARTTARGRAANQVTENARAESQTESLVREEARLYDVVSDDDEDDDAAARAAAVPTASTSTATTLTSTAIGCVKTVTDDALVEAARFYCGSSTKAKALASAAEPSAPSVPTPDSPPREPPPAKPAPSRQPLPWSNKLETFDDMFSMFTGGTAAPSGVSQPSTAANANASRGAAAETFVEALRSQPDPATVTAKTKPKLSFAALMANDEPESFEDSD
jgi:hypothetical protein